MSFLDNLKNKFMQGKEELAAQVSKFRNADFLNAVVSASVLISAADGDISSEEKQKLLAYIQQSDELKVFSTEEVIACFNKIADKYDFDPNIGKGEALKHVVRIKGKPDQARVLISVAIAIANSDGNFDKDEQNVVLSLCETLGISSAEFI